MALVGIATYGEACSIAPATAECGGNPQRVCGPEHEGLVLEWGPVSLRPIDQVAAVNGVEKRLTPLQARILGRLLRARGAVVTNEELWREFDVRGRPVLATIRFHVCSLRGKLDPRHEFIETWPARGYALADPRRRREQILTHR